MILIVRSEEGCKNVKAKLSALGYGSMCYCIFKVWHYDVKYTAHKDEAMIFTSQNAALPSLITRENFSNKIFCVGNSTATSLKAVGFTNIVSISENVDDMCASIKSIVPTNHKLIYFRAQNIAKDLKGALSNYNLSEHVVYQYNINDTGCPAIDFSKIDTLMFFSKRSVELFSLQVSQHINALSTKIAVCISPNVKDAASGIFDKCIAATKPNLDCMLEIIKNIKNEK